MENITNATNQYSRPAPCARDKENTKRTKKVEDFLSKIEVEKEYVIGHWVADEDSPEIWEVRRKARIGRKVRQLVKDYKTHIRHFDAKRGLLLRSTSETDFKKLHKYKKHRPRFGYVLLRQKSSPAILPSPKMQFTSKAKRSTKKKLQFSIPGHKRVSSIQKTNIKRTETHVVLSRPSEKPCQISTKRKIKLSLTKDLKANSNQSQQIPETQKDSLLLYLNSHGTGKQRNDGDKTARTKKQSCMRAYKKTKSFVLGLFKRNKDLIVV
uniref:Uncharacterized protein n=2 Tax=Clytia hemisphaerica TaxID=252671 RepID=A0A7M5X4U4_9CNID